MNKILTLIISIFLTFTVFSQGNKKMLSLEEVIHLARIQSPDAILAKHKFKSSYWEFRSYKASMLPAFTLNANLFEFNNGINSTLQPDGSKLYTRQQDNTSSLTGSITQNIGVTGGTFFINSGVERADNFLIDSMGTSYRTNVLNIGYSQPAFQYNRFKWEKKIEPLIYKEAQQTYLHQMEVISEKAIRYFYSLATAQLNVEIAETNFHNNDTLYQIAKGRYQMGTIAENELLQLELAFLNAKSDLNNSKINLQISMFRLRSFLGISELVELELVPSTQIPKLVIPFEQAFSYAKENNSELIAYARQLLEAERDVAQAHAESRFNASLYASFGLNQWAYALPETYVNPDNQQQLSVGIRIPILDWGEGKGKYKMAQSNEEVVRTQVNQSRIDFEQQVMLIVMQFNEQSNQVMIAAKADTIARKRFEVAKQRFLIGKISVLDLNTASTERDIALRSNLMAQQTYWTYFYNLRQYTLYDFLDSKPIECDFYEIIDN